MSSLGETVELEHWFDDDGVRYYENKETKQKYIGVSDVIRVVPAPELESWKDRIFIQTLKRKLSTFSTGRSAAAYVDTLVKEAKVAHEKIRDAAGNKGTSIHDVFCRHFNEEDVSQEVLASEELTSYFANFGEFCIEWNFRPIHSELKLNSETHRYAGTTDLIGYCIPPKRYRPLEFEEGQELLALCDFKTGRTISYNTRLQLAAYCGAYEEMSVKEPDKYVGLPDISFILHLREGGVRVRNVVPKSEHQSNYHYFIARLDTLKWEKMQRGKWYV